jgi:7-cyano-7-deazaguanine synthase
MCSITGAILPPNRNPNGFTDVVYNLVRTIVAAEERGRDSFGVAEITQKGSRIVTKHIGMPSTYFEGCNYVPHPDTQIFLNNNRAEPTTEYVENKTYEDVQPFAHGGFVIAHNGTIANDKELAVKWEVEGQLETSIDSAVISAILAQRFENRDFSFEEVSEFLKTELIGSYALAVAHTSKPNEVLLMTNYKPLYLAFHTEHKYFMFTSLESYLDNVTVQQKLLTSKFRTSQIEPYSAKHITFEENGNIDIQTYSLRKSEDKNRKALVVCSGGLDSTVVASFAKAQGYEVTLLHFKYKCRAEEKEVTAIEQIAGRIGADFLYVETDIFKSVIGGSRLTGTKDSIADGESGAEFAHEWVPARNLIMLSLATGIAEAKGFDTIMLGNNLEESGAYPDNEMEFVNKFNSILPYATQVDKHVRVEMPVGNLMKWEIVRLGSEIDAPMDLTWSCYEAGEKHCGHCGPCFMRKTAFEMNKLDEVIEYLK